jgi:hypothetical protein
VRRCAARTLHYFSARLQAALSGLLAKLGSPGGTLVLSGWSKALEAWLLDLGPSCLTELSVRFERKHCSCGRQQRHAIARVLQRSRAPGETGDPCASA